MSGLTIPSAIKITRNIAATTGCSSCVGCALLIVCYVMFQELRTYQSRLVVYLSIAGFGNGLGWALAPGGEYEFGAVCTFQGLLLHYSSFSMLLWQLCIAIYILQLNLNITNLERQEKYYHMIGWGLPLIPAGLYLGFNMYGYSGAWCYVKRQYINLGMYAYYLPVGVLCTLIGIMYLIVTYVLYKRTKQASSDPTKAITKHRRLQNRTRIYYIPFLVGWIFSFINRFYYMAYGEFTIPLQFLQAISVPFSGFWNFLMFGLTETIVAPQTIKELLMSPLPHGCFKAFLEECSAAENLSFYDEITSLTHLTNTSNFKTPEWEALAVSICKTYIIDGCSDAVNLSSELHKKLVHQYQTNTLDSAPFIEAQHEVLVTLRDGHFSAFKSSTKFTEMIQMLQAEERQYSGQLLIFVLVENFIIRRLRPKSHLVGAPLL